MILTFLQAASAARGAVGAEADGKWLQLYRFTPEQKEIYDTLKPQRTEKVPATAAIRLAFYTDSQTLSFLFRFFKCSSRLFSRIDVYVNGGMIAHVGLDDYEGNVGRAELSLGEGEKCVEIYLPWAMRAELADITLDDGASFEPYNRSCTMLSFGDSITQGCDSKYPSLSYLSTLARLMDADVINKGINGERFFPELLDTPAECEPTYITVAYGTNDWANEPREKVTAACRAFYRKLSETYPQSTIFAITPIWRENADSTQTPFGAPLSAVYDMIVEETADLANVTVICGDHLVPHIKAFTTDGLHPNDAGAQIYAQNLYLALKPYL